MNDKKSYVIELSGMPGSGKSSLTKLLQKDFGCKQLTLNRKYSKIKYKYLLSIPLFPFILIRFYRVFLVLFISKFKDFNGPTSFRTILSIIFFLSGSVIELKIATLESFFRRKKHLMDGGFIQFGIGIWLRSPPEIKFKIWKAYVMHIPKNILSIIINCEPLLALKRSQARMDGVPSVISSRLWATNSSDYLKQMYLEISDLLNTNELRSKVLCIDISSEEDLKEQVDLLVVKLKDFIAIEKLAIS